MKGMIRPESDDEDEEEEGEKEEKAQIEGLCVQSIEILAFNKL